MTNLGRNILPERGTMTTVMSSTYYVPGVLAA